MALTCQVANCSDEARYKCPRCAVRYCSTSCYAKHSAECVEAFHDRDMQSLRGKKVSDVERRRFAAKLKKLKEDENDEYNRHLNSMTSSHSSTLNTKDDGEEEYSGDEESDEDVAGLLTELMQKLDNNGKDALFSVLHQGMEQLQTLEHQNDRNKETKKTSKKKRQRSKKSVSPPESDAKTTAAAKHDRRKDENEDDDEIDIIDELEELVEDMEMTDMSYEDILQRLPTSLRKDFESRVRDGRIQELIKPWNPWWMARRKVENVRSANDSDDDDDNDDGKSRDVPRLPTASDLRISVAQARRMASATLVFNVVDVIAAYCVTMRGMNGEWDSDVMNAGQLLWTVSSVLSEDRRHSSVHAVCDSIRQHAPKNTHFTALTDCADILSSTNCAVVRALFDTARIVEAAANESCSERMDSVARTQKKAFRKALSKGVHKVLFFVAWALAEPIETFTEIARAVLTEVDIETGQANEVVIAKQTIGLMDGSKKETLWIS